MRTTITARHCAISDELRRRAEAVLRRLAEHARRPVEGTIVFDRAGPRAQAEVRLHCARGELLVAAAEAKDHRSALDRTEEKLRRQLSKEPQPSSRRRAASRKGVA